jgi:hypothetical protein
MPVMDEGRRLAGWALPVAGVVAVVVLVVIGLNREPEQFDPDTPEGTVQSYIAALAAGDFDTAASFWSDQGCAPESIEPTGGTPDISATLVRVEGGGDQATVVIGITDNTADPVNGIYEYQEWFNLIREDEGWRIVQPSWPYYDQICEETAT